MRTTTYYDSPNGRFSLAHLDIKYPEFAGGGAEGHAGGGMGLEQALTLPARSGDKHGNHGPATAECSGSYPERNAAPTGSGDASCGLALSRNQARPASNTLKGRWG